MSSRSVAFLVLFMVVGAGGVSKPLQAQNWWNVGDVTPEAGKLQEVKQKHRVYLTVVFTTALPEVNAQQEQNQIRRLVTRTLESYKEIELVNAADLAEFAITINASQNVAAAGAPATLGNFSLNLDPNVQIPLEVTVLVRGTQQKNGSYRPRIVWSMSSLNVHGEPGPAAVFAVDGFIDQLKKARGEKKK